MASRQELMDSIQPGVKLDKNLFLRIYGYELNWEGFADSALNKLEKAGCSQAREYYGYIVGEWRHGHDKEMDKAAKWCKDQFEKEYENRKRRAVAECRKQQGVEQLTAKNLTKSELKELCRRLLDEGIIETPEQFAMVVLQGQ